MSQPQAVVLHLRHIFITGRYEYGPSAVLRGLWGHTHPGVVINGHTIPHGRCAVFGGGRIGHTELQAQTHQKLVCWSVPEVGLVHDPRREN
jgi:hypothetical protein